MTSWIMCLSSNKPHPALSRGEGSKKKCPFTNYERAFLLYIKYLSPSPLERGWGEATALSAKTDTCNPLADRKFP